MVTTDHSVQLVGVQLVGRKYAAWRGLDYLMEGDEVLYDPRRDRVAPDHPAAQFVARPNENLMESLGELAFRFLVDFYATGNGYLEAARNRRGRVAALYHAPVRGRAPSSTR